MTASTPNLNLQLPGGGSLGIGGDDESADIDVLNQNFQALDTWAGTVDDKVASSTTPSGVVTAFAGSTAPSGWLLCQGQNVSRTTYSDLFEAIGTTFGNGDGTSTFGIPNLKGRVPVGIDSGQTEFNSAGKTGGEKTHTLSLNEIPSHNHSYNTFIKNWTIGTGQTGNGRGMDNSSSQSATSGSRGGGQSHNNLQPYLAINYIIKA